MLDGVVDLAKEITTKPSINFEFMRGILSPILTHNRAVGCNRKVLTYFFRGRLFLAMSFKSLMTKEKKKKTHLCIYTNF